MEKSYKEEVLEGLSLIQDEPDPKSELFQFKKFATHLSDILTDEKTQTPYSIAIHGEWGSGKTSLIRQAYDILDTKLKQKSDWKLIWFDAWEYERIDPVAALLQKIALVYESKSSKFKKIVKGLTLVFSDIVLRANTGLSFKEVQEYFESSVKEIPTITEELEKMVGAGRLVVFVDDLDRCIVENALGILEAIKLFLNAKGVIFVVAVDMKKLERAWQLRYHDSDTGMVEGREHADKIFQLKLSLPPKEKTNIDSYVEKMTSSLAKVDRSLIIEGCPHNPRKIKRILNLVYFLIRSADNTKEFEKQLPLIIIWSIVTSLYPGLAKIIAREPNTLVQMAMFSLGYGSYEELLRAHVNLTAIRGKQGNITLCGVTIGYSSLYPSTMDGLLLVVDKIPEALSLLREVAKRYSMNEPKIGDTVDGLMKRLEQKYGEVGTPLKDIIYKSGLVGYD